MKKSLASRERIYLSLEKIPGQKSTEIARNFGVSHVSVYLHLKELIRERRIERRGNARATRYFPLHQIAVESILSEIQTLLVEKYGEEIEKEQIIEVFQRYMMYIDIEDMISYGFEAFVLWCHDDRHDFSKEIAQKGLEYIDLIGSIEYLRGKNRFLDVTLPAKSILEKNMQVGFNKFYISSVSVLSSGFGSTRRAISLRYGKKNSNSELLRDAIFPSIEPIENYIKEQHIDGVIYAPPTEGRKVQFRDILEKELQISVQKINAEKLPLAGRILEPQKNIRDKMRRIKNALGSMIITIPKNIDELKHILILDDSFTTGATPNAIALKLREAGYAGKITVITICGSFDYDLAVSEDEI